MFGKPSKKQIEEQRERDFLGEFQERFEYSKMSKVELTYDWNDYESLYGGDHWEKQDPKHKVNAIENQAFAIVEGMLPILIDRNPEVLAYANDDRKKPAATMMSKTLSHAQYKVRFSRKFREGVRGMLIYGTSCFKMFWDTEAYNGLGEIGFEEVDIFDIFPDPNARELKECEYFIYRTRMSFDKLKMQYPDKAHLLRDNADMVGDEATRESEQRKIKGKGVADVYEYWYKHYNQEEKTVEIKVATLSNGVLLEDRPSPFEKQEFPFVMLYSHKTKNNFFGYSDLKNIKNMQYALNKAHSIVLENFIKTTNSMIVTSKGSGIKPGQLTTKAAQHLIVNGNINEAIKRLSPEGLPGAALNMPGLLRESISESVGLYDTAKGLANSGVISYSGIAQLTENAHMKLKTRVKAIEDAIEEIGDWFVSLISQFYQERRMIRVSGKDSNYIVEWFDPTEIREVAQEQDPQTGEMIEVEYITQFDVQIKAGSSMILNRANKYQQVFELYQNQAADLDTLLEFADIGDVDEIKRGLIKEGKIADPQAPQTDMQKAIKTLTDKIKFSVSSTDPLVVDEMLQSLIQAAQQTEQQSQQRAEQLNDESIPLEPTEPPMNPPQMPY